MGIYAIEEHFDKITLANNQLREGIIISLDSQKIGNDSRRNYIDKRFNLRGYEIGRKVNVFEEENILANPLLKEQYIYASALLKGYINGEYSLSEVFEVDKLGKFIAIADLLGGHHAMHWNNLRFYYNPITKRLIPIGFDTDSGKKLSWLGGLSLQTGTFYNALKEPILAKEYLKFLEKFSNKEYLENIFENNEKFFKNRISQLHRSFPWSKNLEEYKKNIYYNQDYIKQKLNPIKPLNIYFETLENGNLYLVFENNSYFPIQINNLFLNKRNLNLSKDNLTIPSREISKPYLHKINLNLKDIYKYNNNKISDYSISYRILGTNKLLYSNINNVPFGETKLEEDLLKKKDTLKEFNFINRDDKNKTVLIKKGEWIIDKPLIIPPNYKLTVDKGVNIILEKNGIIISKNGINLMGTKNDPILIKSQNNGLGIFVNNSKSKSYLNNVNFRNLSNPIENALGITGAISFYESDVEIKNCIFENNNSEDSLNIVRSKFLIKDSKFLNTRSDAIDIDFGEGKLENIMFNNIGNDAIDISGTELNADKIIISGAGDKGISIGEGSKLDATNISINNAGIAIASKDGSEVIANSVYIKSSKIGFATYMKKPEYGPAYMNINSNSGSADFDVSNLYLLESQSSFVIDNYRYPVNSENIYKKLYKE